MVSLDSGFFLCLGVVLFDICILTQISVENGVIYEHPKFIRQPKIAFTIRELQEVIARKYYKKGSLFSIMSLDLRFKDEDVNKNEWIVVLPLSTSQEEAEQFASKINRLIQADSRPTKTP